MAAVYKVCRHGRNTRVTMPAFIMASVIGDANFVEVEVSKDERGKVVLMRPLGVS